ncbi:MAG TPA: tRNA pseudouridine(38-40) synthase TruA [Chitinophagaceae bacterium]|nr:tRNA pseudouridine(38-40) synthase TruA [Chitinophagaceae bacterium]
MSSNRYFLEVTYKGTAYSGFQKQENANTVQAEIEKAIFVLHRQNLELTGASRTDAGVHALQNFFHFDFEGDIHPQFLYKINAILPLDIVVLKLTKVKKEAHCRFSASSRAYKYYLCQKKNPFLQDRAYYFPYSIDLEKLNEAANILMSYRDFSSFAKRRTQVKTFDCRIDCSSWSRNEDVLIYYVKANRFLRGMVRGLAGTMLQVGRGKISLAQFEEIIQAKDSSKANFAVPGKGLFLVEVQYPDSLFTDLDA